MIKRTVLQELFMKANIEPDQVRWNYSGRGMFGRTCVGFVGRPSDLARFFLQVGMHVSQPYDEERELLIRDVDHLIYTLTVDNMGHVFIYYFPTVAVEDDVHDDTSTAIVNSP